MVARGGMGGALERQHEWALAREEALKRAREEEDRRQAALMRNPTLSVGTMQLVAQMGRPAKVEEAMAARHDEATRARLASSEHEAELTTQPEITRRGVLAPPSTSPLHGASSVRSDRESRCGHKAAGSANVAATSSSLMLAAQ